MIADYTRMLRRSDELSHFALLIGMVRYQPDAAKAIHYFRQRAAR